jgi:hypothetical protein
MDADYTDVPSGDWGWAILRTIGFGALQPPSVGGLGGIWAVLRESLKYFRRGTAFVT